jgi:hypothetical protein
MTPEQFSRSVRAAAAQHDWAEVDRVCRIQASSEMRAVVARGVAVLSAWCRALTRRSASRRAVEARGD